MDKQMLWKLFGAGGEPRRESGWEGVLYRHHALRKKIEDDLKVIALSLLNSDWTMEVWESREGYEPAVFCPSNWKKHCLHGKPKRLESRLKYRGEEDYVLHADTLAGIYLEIIRLLALDEGARPMVPQ